MILMGFHTSRIQEDQEDDIYEVQNNKSKEKQPKQISPPPHTKKNI